MTIVFRAAQRLWLPSQWPGVDVCSVGDHARSGASIFRMRAGSVITWHDHPLGEHTYILEGEALFGELRVGPGDALYTPHNVAHEVRAMTDVVFLGMAPR